MDKSEEHCALVENISGIVTHHQEALEALLDALKHQSMRISDLEKLLLVLTDKASSSQKPCLN